MESFEPPAETPSSLNPQRMAEFVELYSQHYPRLQCYLMALLPTSSDAADVMQETSLVLWKKFDTFESGTNFFAWACKIARLQTMKQYQRLQRSARLFDTATLEMLAAEAMESIDRPEASLEALDGCLAKLSPEDRRLIRRRYEPGASVKDMAAEIGLSANLLSKSLGRIRRALLWCMQKRLAQEY